MYAEAVGEGPAAVLLQLARLGKLDLESARKIVRSAALVNDVDRQIDSYR
jgi:hypothetical protein